MLIVTDDPCETDKMDDPCADAEILDKELIEDPTSTADFADDCGELLIEDTTKDLKIVVKEFWEELKTDLTDCNCDVCEDLTTILEKSPEDFRVDEGPEADDKADTTVTEDANGDLELASETWSDDWIAVDLSEDTSVDMARED